MNSSNLNFEKKLKAHTEKTLNHPDVGEDVRTFLLAQLERINQRINVLTPAKKPKKRKAPKKGSRRA